MACTISDCPGACRSHAPGLTEVCAWGGDTPFTLATIKRLEALRKTTALPARLVPRYDFAAGEAVVEAEVAVP